MSVGRFTTKPYDCPPWARVLPWIPSHRVQVSALLHRVRANRVIWAQCMCSFEADYVTDAHPQVGATRHPQRLRYSHQKRRHDRMLPLWKQGLLNCYGGGPSMGLAVTKNSCGVCVRCVVAMCWWSVIKYCSMKDLKIIYSIMTFMIYKDHTDRVSMIFIISY